MVVDLQDRLEELAVVIEDAKAMPLSASCIVNRQQVLDLIEEVRQLLPESVYRADELLADREAVVQDGRREADRILSRTPDRCCLRSCRSRGIRPRFAACEAQTKAP